MCKTKGCLRDKVGIYYTFISQMVKYDPKKALQKFSNNSVMDKFGNSETL